MPTPEELNDARLDMELHAVGDGIDLDMLHQPVSVALDVAEAAMIRTMMESDRDNGVNPTSLPMVNDLLERLSQAAADALLTRKILNEAAPRDDGRQLDRDTFTFEGSYGETIGLTYVPEMNIAFLAIHEKAHGGPQAAGTFDAAGLRHLRTIIDRLLTRFS